MKRFLLALALLAGALHAAERKPNVIFILTDDQGWNDAHFAGHPYVKTPNLDRFAAQSTWFRQFYVAATVCSPSRCAFLTSHYPARHFIHGHLATDADNAARSMPNWLDPSVTTLPGLLKSAGYATAHFGKWHLGSKQGPLPAAYGIDASSMVNGPGPQLGADPAKPGDPEANDPYFRAKSTAMIVDETIKFMREHREQPFYINVWTLLPHAHLNPTPEQLAVYESLAPSASDPAFGPWMQKYLANAKDLRSQMQVFCASLTDLDTQLGRLFAAMEEMKLAENTIVFYSSDNGAEDYRIGNAANAGVGNAGPLRARKRSMYEGGIRTFGLLRWPGRVAAGRVEEKSVIGSVDFLPTICKLTGVAVPATVQPDGEDVSDIWLGASRPRTRPLYWEWLFRVQGDDYTPPALATRDGDWKLLVGHDGSHAQLYDVIKDISEEHDVASEHPDVVKTLTAKVLAWNATLPPSPARDTVAATGKAQDMPRKAAAAAKPGAPDRAAMFKKKDANGDGRMTLEEYLRGFPDQTEGRRRFPLFDTNHDGVLTEQEFIRRASRENEIAAAGGTRIRVIPMNSLARLAVFLFLAGVGGSVRAQLEVRAIQVAPPVATSRVPVVTAQGRSLAPQAVSAVDVSPDGKTIAVGTMAFSHEANVWLFDASGTVVAQRNLPPWAPMQVATLAGGKALAAGMAYSRVTPPEPTVWFGPAETLLGASLQDELSEMGPREGELARLRPGSGGWQTGWFASPLGELFAHGPDWLFVPPNWLMDADGHRERLRYENKNQLPTGRALRMAASADGKRIAFGWIAPVKPQAGLPAPRPTLSVWEVRPNRSLWSAPAAALERPPALPAPATDFPEMAQDFHLAADAVAPASVAAAVAINGDGSRIAIVEYAAWIWVRSGPAIGKWDPPIHALNFVPKQRGRLRLFDGTGRELRHLLLPEEGMFEVGFGGAGEAVACWPSSWFARGVAGAVWLPVDAPARKLYRIPVKEGPILAIEFPDAIADCAPNPADGSTAVSCWDGRIYRLGADGQETTRLEIGSPARLAWNADGARAIAGTADGRLLAFGREGALAWSNTIPVAEAPAPAQAPTEVVPGLPIFQGGRIPKSEHAYVGDIWVIKNGRDAVFVDSAGTSGLATTAARLRALGIDRVTHVLLTHTHGDHSGGAQLWRATGAKVVAPKSAALALTWLMPMLSDYGLFPPCPLDVPLPLARCGDETEFEAGGLKFGALFVPGHSFDLTMYKVELAGRRVVFTGDLGFEAPADILHRCWGDADKARAAVATIKEKLLPWKPDVVFTGHGVRPFGMAFLTDLVRRTEESLAGP